MHLYTIIMYEGGEIMKDKQSEFENHPRDEQRGKRNRPHKEGLKHFVEDERSLF